MLGQSFVVEPAREYQCEFSIGLNLGAGEYTVQAAVHTGIEHTANCFDWVDPAVKFAVAGFRDAPFVGVTGLACTARDQQGQRQPATVVVCRRIVDRGRRSRLERVLVRNDGTEAWPCDGTLAVHLSYRWIDAAGNVIPVEGKRFNLPAPVEPGATAAVVFTRPEPPSDAARLRLTLVQELVAWFDDVGGPTLDLPVIRASRDGTAPVLNERRNGDVDERDAGERLALSALHRLVDTRGVPRAFRSQPTWRDVDDCAAARAGRDFLVSSCPTYCPRGCPACRARTPTSST